MNEAQLIAEKGVGVLNIQYSTDGSDIRLYAADGKNEVSIPLNIHKLDVIRAAILECTTKIQDPNAGFNNFN